MSEAKNDINDGMKNDINNGIKMEINKGKYINVALGHGISLGLMINKKNNDLLIEHTKFDIHKFYDFIKFIKIKKQCEYVIINNEHIYMSFKYIGGKFTVYTASVGSKYAISGLISTNDKEILEILGRFIENVMT